MIIISILWNTIPIKATILKTWLKTLKIYDFAEEQSLILETPHHKEAVSYLKNKFLTALEDIIGEKTGIPYTIQFVAKNEHIEKHENTHKKVTKKNANGKIEEIKFVLEELKETLTQCSSRLDTVIACIAEMDERVSVEQEVPDNER